MTTACPICSVLNVKDLENPAFIRSVTIHQGQRSRRHFLVRPLGCKHGPAEMPADSDDGAALVGIWNTWANSEAIAKADRLKFTPEQRAMWLYHLGLEPHPTYKPEAKA